MILLVAHEKGGVGKSTIATNMAIMRSLADREVLLVDADPQESATEFSRVRTELNHQPEFSTVGITGTGLYKEVSRMVARYDDIVIDCGGRDTATLRQAMMVADTLLVPILPGQFDAWSSEGLAAIVNDAMAISPLTVKMFFNKVDTNPKIHFTDDAEMFIAGLKDSIEGMVILETRVCYRVAYRRAVADGLSVIELPRTDPKACREMTSLYKEVYGEK
jgi:chromosome partitioning protein